MNLIVLGPPGAGKSTQAQRLEADRALKHLSTEKILRTEMASGSELGDKLKTVMDADQPVPDGVMVAMIAARIGAPDCAEGFVLNGFPRTVAQAEALDVMFEEHEISLDHVIQIVVPEDAMVEKISGRMVCDQCGINYHAFLDPPHFDDECDDCGPTKFTRRPEDSADSVRARMTAYEEETAPLLPYYQEREVLTDVDGMTSPDEIAKQIEDLLNAA
jgi:adenylate kinase